MKRVLMASVIAGTVAIATVATPTSAHARWGRGWGWGLGGLALGLTIAAALSRPAYAYGYGYPAYSYGYGPAYRGRLRELWLRLSCLQLRQLRLSGVWLWRRLLSASLSLRLLWRLSTSLPSRRLRRLSGRPPRCDPPRSLALSRLSGTT